MNESLEPIKLKCLSSWCQSHGLGGSIPLCSRCWAVVPDKARASVIRLHGHALRSGVDGNPFVCDPACVEIAAAAVCEAGLALGKVTVHEAAARLSLARAAADDIRSHVASMAAAEAADGDEDEKGAAAGEE